MHRSTSLAREALPRADVVAHSRSIDLTHRRHVLYCVWHHQGHGFVVVEAAGDGHLEALPWPLHGYFVTLPHLNVVPYWREQNLGHATEARVIDYQ